MNRQNCICCNSEKVKVFFFLEGKILICYKCKIQWGSVRKETISLANSGISYYMHPNSIEFPKKYPPYCDFFEFIENKFDMKNSDINILDIGCGNGVFIKECVRRKYNAFGVEVDKKLKILMSDDIFGRIDFKPIEDVDEFKVRFDIITFWDCYEHLENGFSILENLRKFLKPNGVIYLRVNNNKDIFNYIVLFCLSFSPWLGKKLLKKCFNFPTHLWNFSEKGIKQLLDQNNWKVIYSNIGETPPSRLTKNILFIFLIWIGYSFNKIVRGGKIGNYYIVDKLHNS